MCTAILDGPSNEHHQMLTEFLESDDPELAFPPTLHKAQREALHQLARRNGLILVFCPLKNA